ncbi:MAG TPA: phosphomannomutase/phosphoglucomutase [Actinobacteria bacterium]|nr:phosphomannomutase/phosphoglucomutase [Actinomycetota bacterium]
MDLPGIFKAYDVRGLVPAQLDAEAARRIGVGFAEFAGAETIAVGRDCRRSSPVLAEALGDGIVSRGVDVLDVGAITTDMAYFVSGARELPAVMITASHNPPDYNGMKFCLAGAAPVGRDTGLEEIRRIAEAPPTTPRPRGRIHTEDVRDAYVDHLFTIVDAEAIAPLRVAADGGNGMAGVVLPLVFDRVAAELDGLYLEPDGTFPNHPPDPLNPENLRDLEALMARRRPDLGVAFDGDADRAFFVDDRGVPLPGSTTTAIIAEWFLRREPGATIVHNLICSKAVPETIERAGGKPVRTRVGHSFIKQVMAETNAVFGGEHSGHYYYRDNYRADSGILTLLVLLEILSERGLPLSELREPYEPYVASGELNFEVADKEATITAVEAAFAGADVDHLDGLTVDLGEEGWFNLRPSNTEPVLRLNVEAPDRDRLEALVARVREIVES